MHNKQSKKQKFTHLTLVISCGLFLGTMAFKLLPELSRVYVNQSYDDQTEAGSYSQPFRKIGSALNSLTSGGTLDITAGHYAAEDTYTKSMTFYPRGGSVVLEPFPSVNTSNNRLQGAVCNWGEADCNACANNVSTSFTSLKSSGNIMAFWLGVMPKPGWDIIHWPPWSLDEFKSHYQGFARLMPGGGKYIALPESDKIHDVSRLDIVYMGSRASGGYYFGSNRYDSTQYAPPSSDKGVKYVQPIAADFHPGGIQAIGNYLIVGAGNTGVHLYNISDPTKPSKIGTIITRPNTSGSSVGIAKLKDDRYLVVVSSTDAHPLDFYVSDGTNIAGSYSNMDRWEADEIIPGGWPRYQSINAVTQCGDGNIYLIGTYNNGSCSGDICYPWSEDHAQLIKVEVYNNNVRLTNVSDFHATCTYSDNRQCSFAAAAGIYVTKDHKLAVYSSQHGADSPGTWVEFMEYGQ